MSPGNSEPVASALCLLLSPVTLIWRSTACLYNGLLNSGSAIYYDFCFGNHPGTDEERNIQNSVASARLAGAAEVIVVDGGSSDRTVELIKDDARVLVAEQPGRSSQQNLGANEATGDVLLFLHADCQLAPDSISELRRQLETLSGVVGGSFRQVIDASGFRFRALEAGNHFRASVLRCPFGDQALFVRTEVFRQLGGFPKLRFMEDLYFVKQLRRVGGMRVLECPLTVSARRWQQHGVIRQTLRNWALLAAASLGASPDRLSRFYPNTR